MNHQPNVMVNPPRFNIGIHHTEIGHAIYSHSFVACFLSLSKMATTVDACPDCVPIMMMFPDNSKQKIRSFICFGGRAPQRIGSYQTHRNCKLIYRLQNRFDSRILPPKHKNLETLVRDRTG